ncbi:MAG: SRPBCC domain-containing protein [Leifsonia sp.]
MPGLTGSFTIPLDLPLPPEQVWPYFAERALREKWVRMPGPSRTAYRRFDFRVGGGETLSNTFTSRDQLEAIENRSVFVNIVENERIIFTYQASVAGQLRWVALATVDLAPAADRTRLDWTEQYSFVRLSTPGGVDDVKHLIGGTRLRLNGLVALVDAARTD